MSKWTWGALTRALVASALLTCLIGCGADRPDDARIREVFQAELDRQDLGGLAQLRLAELQVVDWRSVGDDSTQLIVDYAVELDLAEEPPTGRDYVAFAKLQALEDEVDRIGPRRSVVTFVRWHNEWRPSTRLDALGDLAVHASDSLAAAIGR